MKRVVSALLAVVLMVGVATPAQAYANAFFPTQSAGNRGADVLAIQYRPRVRR